MKNEQEVNELLDEANMAIIDSTFLLSKILAKIKGLTKLEEKEEKFKIEVKGQFLPGTDIPSIKFDIEEEKYGE